MIGNAVVESSCLRGYGVREGQREGRGRISDQVDVVRREASLGGHRLAWLTEVDADTKKFDEHKAMVDRYQSVDQDAIADYDKASIDLTPHVGLDRRKVRRDARGRLGRASSPCR